MNVLVCCEESQRVCLAFRKYGHIAFSNDIQLNPSGGHPEWHIGGDCMRVLQAREFVTADKKRHTAPKWDIVIAHPPCTYLSFAGNRSLSVEKYGEKARERLQKRSDAMAFFMGFVRYAEKTGVRMCIENPLGYPCTAYRPADQIINPCAYAEKDSPDFTLKRTCLWLFRLPPLVSSQAARPHGTAFCEKQPHIAGDGLSADEYRRKLRSKTFLSVADAMAQQWGDIKNYDGLQLPLF